MGLYLRGKIYWFTIKEKGKRIQESTGTGNKKLAVSKLLGHRDISTTQRYAHHYPESLRSSVEILNRVTIMLQSGMLHEVASGVSP